ncbi:MAG: diphthamide synthesis protein [Candidatus Pacearchaeota archaeon]
MKTAINLIESDYDLELDKVVKTIKKQKAKLVCIQLPDGLKQKATEIAEFLENKTNAKILIWFGTCFGACDIPNLPKEIDLFIQFGHSAWKK